MCLLRLQSLVPLSLDLFATRLNIQLPMFVCPFPEAVVADALSFLWTFLSVMFAFPPPVLFPAVLSRFCLEQALLLLVIVFWLLASLGIQTFLELLFTFSLSFPLVSKVLFLAHRSHEDRQPSSRMDAVRCSSRGRSSSRAVFDGKWRIFSIPLDHF